MQNMPEIWHFRPSAAQVVTVSVNRIFWRSPVAIAEERAKMALPALLWGKTPMRSRNRPHFVPEVLAANGDVIVQENNGFTPTPAVSNAIPVHNKKRGPLADGINITPSHNPPEDGGIKYNPPNGGPADTNVTKVVVKYRATRCWRMACKALSASPLMRQWPGPR